MPFLLLFTALCIGATFFIADVAADPRPGRCSSSPTSPTRRRSSTTTRRSRPCRYPATRGRLSGIGDGDRLLRDGRRRAADLPARRRPSRTGSGSPALLYLRLRRSRSSWSSASRARATSRRSASADVVASFGQLRASIEHARAVPGTRAVPARPVLLQRRGEHGHRRDERRHGRGAGRAPTRRPT